MHRTTGASLRIEALRKEYPGGVLAVDDVSLSIDSGEFLTLLGPSGSGKTTLLMMIAGFTTPTAGEIWIDDRPVSRIAPQHRGLGMVFQNYALFPHMSVAQNIAFPLEMRHQAKADIRAKVTTALEVVQLPGYEDRLPRQLSGGQQQRVALARAIVFEPPVLLMDEPLGALDKRLREQMQLELVQIKQRLNVTVIYVTHDQEEALTMSDRIAVMRHGRIEQVGEPFQLYEEPTSAFVADFVGESNFIRGSVVRIEGNGLVEVDSGQSSLYAAAPKETVLVGDRVQIAIRPERIVLQPTTTDQFGPNQFLGRVEEVIYVGDATKYRVAVGTVALSVKVQHQHSDETHRRGDEVTVSWNPVHAKVVGRVSDGAEELGA